jgi:coenzyme F420 biosynthesis associated uncharacterized protein
VVSSTASQEIPELVDWALAAKVGRRVAGGTDLAARGAWSRQFTELSTTADHAVAEFTGLGGELPPPVAEPLDRGQWIDGNLATLRRVLRPLAAKVATRRAWRASGPVPSAVRSSTRLLTGAEAGTLLGYVGQRVLGQYDLPVPTADGAAEGTVWYVVPNIVQTERRHGFKPADFRLWIALHETAHRRQFRGVRWLPGHIQGLLDSYLGSVQIDEEGVKRVAQRAQELVKRLMAGDRVDLLDLLVTAEQRGTLERVQATMSVLEGHGEFVMDEVGAKLVPGHDRMKRILHERRQASGPGARLVQELLGLRQKLDQYSQGEAFVRRLYDRGGMEAVNRVFASPDALPTVDEVRDPDRYLARAG